MNTSKLPLGFVKVESSWAIPRLKAALDQEEENQYHKFANQVNRYFDTPIKKGMLWWKSVHYRTFEEADKAARRSWLRSGKVDVFPIEYFIETDVTEEIYCVLIAAMEQPSIMVALEKYPKLFIEPYRPIHRAKRE